MFIAQVAKSFVAPTGAKLCHSLRRSDKFIAQIAKSFVVPAERHVNMIEQVPLGYNIFAANGAKPSVALKVGLSPALPQSRNSVAQRQRREIR